MCVNAMNCWHRKIANEPPIITELLSRQSDLPFWGADSEDSKTPLRDDLIAAGVNLTKCFRRTIAAADGAELAKEKLAVPIKRFPGLALPCAFMFLDASPVPLHLYDFALHVFHNWNNPAAMCFYVPKLENEEEAAYIAAMCLAAERLVQAAHPEFRIGTIRLMIVLENPRAVFRVHEIMDALHPYFAGASLGWHDFLASTARLFKNDPQFRIPVKSDADIVIKYIKASHELLARVVGPRGGVTVW